MERLPVPVPPAREQRTITKAIESTFPIVEVLAEQLATVRHAIGTLDRAILAKAFRGELVPQDPRDEPADELLARVRVDQAAPSTPRGRKRAAEAALHD